MPTFIPQNSNSKNQVSHSKPVDQKESVFSSTEGKDVKKFIEDTPVWELDEIILNQNVRETINDVITFCQNKDKLIKEWNLNKFLKGNASIGINLYGEPGTGKSITAEAVAHALGKKIIRVDYSEIQDSKWGATEKNLTALFKTAEKNGSVIFMDEADGLLSKRSTTSNSNNGVNEIKSHLLTLVDRSNVIIIYATNLFKNFDRAFFRRILYHIKYPMPTQDELVKLWQFHLGNPNIPKSSDFSYEEISKVSEGLLAGGDIKNITLKLCVKLAAKKITVLDNNIIKSEIEQYKVSLADSRGEIISEKTDSQQDDTVIN